jgi:hypothetical protein
MANRFVSVGDDLTLPADVKAADGNLPARLQDAALSATILDQTKGKVDATVAAASVSVNADHAAGFARVQRAFLAAPDGLYLGRSGNDYTFLVGLGGGRYGAWFLPRFAQSLNSVTYTVNCLSGCGVQMPMLSVDDGDGTYGGSWANQFTSTVTSPGYKAKALTVTTTSGSGTITVVSGTVTSADIGRRVQIPGAGAAGATLESTINSVTGSTFAIGTAPSASLTGVAATISPSYRYNATAGATATWTSPASSTALAVGVLTAQNGGLAKVTIDTDATLANLLPTAQQMVDSARYPNTILVANGGTLNPTDRVLDCYSGSSTTFFDQKKMIAEGLAAAAHTVVLTVTGYTPTGGTGARTYVDRFASATATTTPTTAGAEMFTAYDLSPGFGSAWEYAIDCKPVGGSTFTFVGQVAHQLEDQTGFSVYIDDLGATPADGSITACNSAQIVRTTKLYHPETGAALASAPWATSIVTYRLDRRGLSVTPDLSGGSQAMNIRTAYSMLPLAPRTGIPTKTDKAALEASATIQTMTGSSTRKGFSRSASAWAWDSTGKVGAAMYIPDHYNFTDGYTVPGLSQVEDRGGAVPTTKFYFPWAGPDVERTFPAGFRKRWTTRYMIGYFADANATLSVL